MFDARPRAHLLRTSYRLTCPALPTCRAEGRDILIVARTDARQAESLEEALWRVAAFADAGADVVFVDALASVEEMRRFVATAPRAAKVGLGVAGQVADWRRLVHCFCCLACLRCWEAAPRQTQTILPPTFGPTCLSMQMANLLEGGGKSPILPRAQLEEMGFKLAAYPLSLLGVSVRAMEVALQGLKHGEIPQPPTMPTFQVGRGGRRGCSVWQLGCGMVQRRC